MMFRLLDKSEIQGNWEVAKKLLKPALCRSFHVHDIDDYLKALLEGEVHMWVAEDPQIIGVVITSFVYGRNGKVMQVLWLGGKKLKQWSAEMELAFTMFAKANNCKQIEAVTRKGFSGLIKSFKPQGLELFIKVV